MRRADKRGISLCCPNKILSSITQVDIDDLIARSIRGVILDLDNTLVEWKHEEVQEAVMQWIENVKSRGLQLCILSNSLRGHRVFRLAEKIGVTAIGQAKKPLQSGFHRAMKALGTTPENTVIIGDQMFTDILGGNRLGIHTIMVHPIHKSEFIYTRFISRPPERILLKYFKKSGHV